MKPQIWSLKPKSDSVLIVYCIVCKGDLSAEGDWTDIIKCMNDSSCNSGVKAM